jgi:hypothetical protein
MSGARERIAANPFHVLELDATCGRVDVERAGQRWLGALALGIQGANSYSTPLGPRPRTEEAVRLAMAALRDPDQRLRHELWLRLPAAADGPAAPLPASPAGDDAPWTGALAAIGWRQGCSR